MADISGQSIQGYDLKQLIGVGGFGAVYRANQRTIGREVAVKIILPEFANNPEFIRRFEIEAQVISRLEHLHIVPLYDYWRDAEGAYLVMRWLRGGSLKEALQDGALNLGPASKILDQLASGLNAAHRQQIIHSDLKPSNILLDEDGNAYLADFGIAQDLLGSGQPVKLGGSNKIAGSLAYMSPEQALGESITARSDIYSLGIIMFETLTGWHPFPGLTSVQHLFKHINEPLPEVELENAELSAAVNHVLKIATEKNPKHRYKDSLEFAAAFRDASGQDRQSDSTEVVESLTRREQEILCLIVEGKSNKQIAHDLFVEVSTIKWHITQIYKKLGVRSRVQATIRARELNLIVSTDELEIETSDEASISIVLPEPANPYKGLRAFEPADNRDFFGRETLIDSLLSMLDFDDQFNGFRNNGEGKGRFLALIGPSGSGKSSLVKAGIIPALWSGKLPDSEKWFIVEMMPGSRPLDEIEITLTRIAADQAPNLRAHLDRDRYGLLRAANLVLPGDKSELILVIDQFEELYTLVDDDSIRNHFLDLIEGAVSDPRSRVRVIITLRADYYDRPLQHPSFGELVRANMETLLPLTAEELERAIVNPANQAGVTFEPGLVATIIEDVSYRPGALPLMQYALTELFESRSGRVLSAAEYDAFGGAAGALARRAEELYQEQDDFGCEAIHQMFLRLVTVEDPLVAAEGFVSLDTRRRVTRAELLSANSDPDRLDEIIDTYANYRLLSLDHHPATRQPTVEVAHEAILREWERLSLWLEESRADLSTHRQLGWVTADWLESGRDDSFLLRGSRLGHFENWLVDTQLVLTQSERDFLVTSSTRRQERADIELYRHQKEVKLEQRASQRLKALLVVMTVALVIAVGLTTAAVLFGRQAEDQRRLAISRELAAASFANLSSDPELSILLALEAAERTTSEDGSILPEVIDILHQSVQAYRIQSNLPMGGVAAYSPDGNTLAVGDRVGFLKLFDLSTGLVIREFDGHMTNVSDVAFTPDGRFLISSGADTLIKIWEVHSGRQLENFIGIGDEVIDIDISSDGKQLAAASRDNSLRIWEISDDLSSLSSINQRSDPLFQINLDSEATGVAFNPDGNQIAAIMPGSTVKIWDVATSKLLLEFGTANPLFSGISFSPDGKYLAGSSGDVGAMIWDAETGEEIQYLADTAPITGAVFSIDGTILATMAENGTWSLWDVNTGRLVIGPLVHGNSIDRIAFSPDGQQLATSGWDGKSKIWDISPAGSRELFTIIAHEGAVNDSVFSPDGAQIATIGEDGRVNLWKASLGELLLSFPGQPGWLNFPLFTHDSKRLVATNPAGGVSVWDANSGRELFSLQNDSAKYTTFALDSEDSRLISGGQNGVIDVWDLNNQKLLLSVNGGGAATILIFFSQDDRNFWSVEENGQFTYWDSETGEIIHQSLAQSRKILDGEWSPAAQYSAFASWFGEAVVIEHSAVRETTNLVKPLYIMRGHAGRVTGVAFNPEGSILATSGFDGTVKLWDMATGEEILTLTGHSLAVTSVDFSPDGRYLVASGADGTIRVFVLAEDELIALARSRVSRSLTREECQRYLHLDRCPDS